MEKPGRPALTSTSTSTGKASIPKSAKLRARHTVILIFQTPTISDENQTRNPTKYKPIPTHTRWSRRARLSGESAKAAPSGNFDRSDSRLKSVHYVDDLIPTASTEYPDHIEANFEEIRLFSSEIFFGDVAEFSLFLARHGFDGFSE